MKIYSQAELKPLRKNELSNQDLLIVSQMTCVIYEIKDDVLTANGSGQEIPCTRIMLRVGSGFIIWKVAGKNEIAIKNLKIDDVLKVTARVNTRYLGNKGMNNSGNYTYIQEVIDYEFLGRLQERDRKSVPKGTQQEENLSEKLEISLSKEKPTPKTIFKVDIA